MLKGFFYYRFLCLFISSTFLLFVPSSAFSSDLETILMPGRVIEGHAEWENECKKCHQVFGDLDQSALCLDCHEKIDADIKKKKGYHGRYIQVKRQECTACHTDHIGRDGDIVKLDKETFDHHLTDFKLKGTHKKVDCRLCHKKDKPYRETKSKCNDCHKKDDPHKASRLGKKFKGKCEKCHQEIGWAKTKFDHDKTKFKLKYEHKKVNCAICHPNDKFLKTPQKCYSCHRLNDIHRGGNGKDCKRCHNERGWKKVKFDHNDDTTFKLEGRHKEVTCVDCHKDDKDRLNIKKRKKKKKSRGCYSCHKQDDEHKGTFGKKCQTCHGVKNWWVKRKFIHDRDTEFKLKGSHKKLDCNDCHRGGNVYKEKLGMTCYTCHKVDDTHRGQQGKDCQNCHNEKGWREKVVFDHDITKFPLIGLHAITPCEECHISNSFKDVKIACYSCHKKDDNHKRTLGEDCNKCHNPNDWNLWRFDHDKQTKFKIDGKHKDLICSDCHKTAVKKLQSEPRTCIRCHASDDHHNGAFGNNCDQCHSTESFREHSR